MRRRNVDTALSKHQAQLKHMVEEQLSLESILDRCAQLYRQTHHERRQMVATWKEAVQSMHGRDHDIQTCETDLRAAKLKSEQQHQQLKEQMEFLEQQLQNNRETERAIAQLNDDQARVRTELHECTEDVTLRINEYVTLKKLLQNTTNRLQQRRHRNRLAAKEQREKEAAVEKTTRTYAELREKFEQFQGRRFNAQERLRHLDELVEVHNFF